MNVLEQLIRDAEMQHLMNMLKKHRRTYSDTPGMGNAQPYTIPGRLPEQDGEHMLLQDFLMKTPGTWDQRMDFERHRLDRENNNNLFFNATRQPAYQPEGGLWDKLPQQYRTKFKRM